jgi:hypothetical protein
LSQSDRSWFAVTIGSLLELEVEGANAKTAAVHGGQHLAEVAVLAGRGFLWRPALVDAMGVDDDLGALGLAEDLGQANGRNTTGGDQVSKDRPGTDRGNWSTSPTIRRAA